MATSFAASARRPGRRRHQLVSSPRAALLALLLLLSGAGHARVARSQEAPEPSSNEAPSSNSAREATAAAAAAASPSMAAKAATAATSTSSSPSPSPSPAAPARTSLPLCPSQGDPAIQLAATASGSEEFSGTLSAGCTASFELDTSSCLSSPSPRRFLTLQAWAATAAPTLPRGGRGGGAEALAPLLLMASASGPAPRAERVREEQPETNKRKEKDKDRRHEGNKRGWRTRRALLAPTSPAPLPSSVYSSPGSSPTFFSYSIHPPDALADAVGLAEGQQIVQTDLLSSKIGTSSRSIGNSSSSSSVFRVAVFAARVPQSVVAFPVVGETGRERGGEGTPWKNKDKKSGHVSAAADPLREITFTLSWRCDASPACPSQPPSNSSRDAAASQQQQHCSGRGECRAFPAGCDGGGACASCECGPGTGGRDCSQSVRELEVVEANGSPSSSSSYSEKEGVGFSSSGGRGGSKGASSRSSSAKDGGGCNDGSRHTFGIRVPSSSSSSNSSSSSKKGGTLLLEMVRGS